MQLYLILRLDMCVRDQEDTLIDHRLLDQLDAFGYTKIPHLEGFSEGMCYRYTFDVLPSDCDALEKIFDQIDSRHPGAIQELRLDVDHSWTRLAGFRC